VTLGVRFASSVGGTVTGMRFYESAGNKGARTGALWSASATHKGSIWASTGTRLAAVTFQNETALGWQTISIFDRHRVSGCERRRADTDRRPSRVPSQLRGEPRLRGEINGLSAPVTNGPVTTVATGSAFMTLP
jgi:hypothetical protein